VSLFGGLGTHENFGECPSRVGLGAGRAVPGSCREEGQAKEKKISSSERNGRHKDH